MYLLKWRRLLSTNQQWRTWTAKGFPRFTSSNERNEQKGGLCDAWLRALKANGVPDPDTSLDLIVRHVTQRSSLLESTRDVSLSMTKEQIKRVEEMCAARGQRVPVQYLIGDVEFRYLNLAVRPPVLIPRPETEVLLELIKDTMTNAPYQKSLDIGCGSGAIALSLLKESITITCDAIDVSEDAIHLTQYNAERLNLANMLSLSQMDIKDVEGTSFSSGYDLIVSNPPYIPEGMMSTLQPEVRDYEDWGALSGGATGTEIIDVVLMKALQLLNLEGDLWLEFDSTHPAHIMKWCREHTGLRLVNIHKDYTGTPRFCHLRREL